MNTKGNDFFAHREYEKALECYQLAFRNAGYYETKNKAAYLSFEAFALNKLERFAEALDRANEALRYDSGNSFAKEQRTTAVELPVKLAEEHNVKGNEHCTNKQFIEAIECYKLAGKYVLGNKVSRSSYLSHEAFALVKLERFDEAVEKCNEALFYNPANEFAKEQRTSAGDLRYQKAKELNNKGNEYCNQREFAKALECFTQAVLLSADNTFTRSSFISHQAFALNQLARYFEAYTKANEALALNSNNAFAKDQLTDAEDQLQSTKFSYDCEEGAGGKKCDLGKKKIQIFIV